MLFTITTPGLALNTYLLIDPETQNGVVIDPPRDIRAILNKIKESKANIIGILETHVHADFVSGSKELKHQLNNAPLIYCSGLGGKEWTPQYADVVVHGNDEVNLGSLRLIAKHTPGHTPEHLIWLTEKQAFTGDFLLIGSVGRPDLLGKQNLDELTSKLYDSVFSVLATLPDELEIYPAHGAGSLCGKGISPKASSTLGYERKSNPYLQSKPKQEWAESLLKNMPPAPSYFPRMKKMNVQGPKLLNELNKIKKVETLNSGLVIDLRSKEAFAKQHYPGSINIPYSPSFINWAAALLPYDQTIIFVSEDQQTVEKAAINLRLVGLDNNLSFYIVSGPFSPAESFPLITPRDLYSKLEKTLVIDVRTPGEWQAGHIPKAMHVTLNDLQQKMGQIPREKPIAVICGSGYRSSIGASILKKNGFKNVSNVQGGMGEWMRERLPIASAMDEAC